MILKGEEMETEKINAPDSLWRPMTQHKTLLTNRPKHNIQVVNTQSGEIMHEANGISTVVFMLNFSSPLQRTSSLSIRKHHIPSRGGIKFSKTTPDKISTCVIFTFICKF